MASNPVRMTRRRFLRLAAGVTAGGLLGGLSAVACKPAGGEPKPAPKGKVRVEWWSHTHKPWNDELMRQKGLYEAQDDSVEINYTIYPGEELITKFTTAMQAGTGPDMIGAHSMMCPNFIAGGWIAEVPTWVEEDIKKRFFPVCVDGATFRGKLYGYNQHIGGRLMLASEDLFTEKGFDYPETWDDMVALTEVWDEKEDDTYTQAVANYDYSGEGLYCSWGAVLLAHGGSILSEDLKSAAFNTDIGREATEMYLRFVHPDMGNSSDCWIQSKTLIYEAGPWIRPSFNEQAPDKVLKALRVLKGPKVQVQTDYVWNWLVSKSSSDEKKEACYKFSQFLNSTENQVSMVKASSLIPTTMEALEHPDVQKDEWVKTHIEELARKVSFAAKISNWAQVQKAIDDQFSLLAVGEQSIADTLRLAEGEVNKLLEEAEIWA